MFKTLKYRAAGHSVGVQCLGSSWRPGRINDGLSSMACNSCRRRKLGCSRDKTGCRRWKESRLSSEYDTTKEQRKGSRPRARKSVALKPRSSAKESSLLTSQDRGACVPPTAQHGGNSTGDANRQLQNLLTSVDSSSIGISCQGDLSDTINVVTDLFQTDDMVSSDEYLPADGDTCVATLAYTPSEPSEREAVVGPPPPPKADMGSNIFWPTEILGEDILHPRHEVTNRSTDCSSTPFGDMDLHSGGQWQHFYTLPPSGRLQGDSPTVLPGRSSDELNSTTLASWLPGTEVTQPDSKDYTQTDTFGSHLDGCECTDLAMKLLEMVTIYVSQIHKSPSAEARHGSHGTKLQFLKAITAKCHILYQCTNCAKESSSFSALLLVIYERIVSIF